MPRAVTLPVTPNAIDPATLEGFLNTGETSLEDPAGSPQEVPPKLPAESALPVKAAPVQVKSRLSVADLAQLSEDLESIEGLAPERVQLNAFVDRNLFIQIRRQKGGPTQFIIDALEKYLLEPRSVLSAIGRLSARRKDAPGGAQTIASRVPPILAADVEALSDACNGKVAGVTTNKIVGGCVLLLAEERKLIQPNTM